MYLYIAYRNLKDHYAQNNVCGCPSYNNDYRFNAICDGVYYLLTKGNMNYAVSKENGDKFIEEVKSKCNGEHFGYFPLVPSLNGKEPQPLLRCRRTETSSITIWMMQSFFRC